MLKLWAVEEKNCSLSAQVAMSYSAVQCKSSYQNMVQLVRTTITIFSYFLHHSPAKMIGYWKTSLLTKVLKSLLDYSYCITLRYNPWRICSSLRMFTWTQKIKSRKIPIWSVRKEISFQKREIVDADHYSDWSPCTHSFRSVSQYLHCTAATSTHSVSAFATANRITESRKHDQRKEKRQILINRHFI